MITILFLAALACNGTTDDTAAFNQALELAYAGRDKTIELPAGTCIFNSTPNQIRNGVNVKGQNKSHTVLQFNQGTGLRLCDQGSVLSNFSITTGPSVNGSIGLHLTNCDGKTAGNHVIEHMWITSVYGRSWTAPLILDGSLRTAPPQGLRTVTLNDVSTFNATWWSASVWDCIGCEWRGGGTYQGQGTTSAIAVGGPQATNNVVDMNYDKATSVIYPSAMRK